MRELPPPSRPTLPLPPPPPPSSLPLLLTRSTPNSPSHFTPSAPHLLPDFSSSLSSYLLYSQPFPHFGQKKWAHRITKVSRIVTARKALRLEAAAVDAF
ncbi:unnamed protein product [Protopolystoma xenopodis]|uniref:Uncharacterized protein n=1 Tax=Protopolystoma xenopodis TaxID=117903 RepID=A0A3S5CNB6_9PLAT|nr:unnamed protein product [Protopolystoma xenopodis]